MILPPCESRINARKTKSLQELILSFSKIVEIFYWPFLCKMFKSSSQSDFNRKVWFDDYYWSFLAGTTIHFSHGITLALCSAPRDRTDSGHSSVTGSSLGRSGAGARSEARNRNIELERDGRPEGNFTVYCLPSPCVSNYVVGQQFWQIQNLML